MPSHSGKESFENLVISELSEIRKDIRSSNIDHAETRKEVKLISKEVTNLKFKSSIWGAVSGALTFIGAAIGSTFFGGSK